MTTTRHWLILVTAILTGALVGCGDDDSATGSASDDASSSTPAGRTFDNSEVFEHLDATKDNRFGGDDDWIITLPSGDTCDVSGQILKSPAEIQMYASAGDPVATNSEGWMGIVVSSYEGATKSCLDEVQRRLADFE